LQSLLFQDFRGKQWDEPRGQDSLGSSPLNRAYRADDGWLWVAVPPSARTVLDGVDGFATGGLEGPALEARLEAVFTNGAVDKWVTRLRESDIGAHRVVFDMRELLTDPWVEAHGLSVTRDHEGWGPITTTGPTQRLSRTPVMPGRASPRPGSDGRAILNEIGLGGRADALVEAGVVVTEGVEAMVGDPLR
jgi:crotonobetainyl-CoA:carnitine CoA-transferase CaiB-like acyl-CoA transferase